MNERPNDRLNEIVDAAFGDGAESAVRSGDRAKLSQFKAMAKSLKARYYDAPDGAVAQAMSLVPKLERRLVPVRLVRTTLGLAGVRLESGQEHQALFEADGLKVRVMYGRKGQAVEIAGRIDGTGWSVECAGQEQECRPDGRFEFQVPDPVGTSLVFRSASAEVRVPGLEELSPDDDGMGRPR